MQRIWLVALYLFVLLAMGCTNEKEIGLVKFGEIEPGCTNIAPEKQTKVENVASEYFRTEVGVSVTKIAFGQVSECTSKWIVPVIASTPQVTTSRVWYVEIARPEMIPNLLIRPE